MSVRTQEEYDVAKQQSREYWAKIELLNSNYQPIGNLTGQVIGTPSFTNNSSSDIRRSCSFDIEVTDDSYKVAKDGKIWIDKNVRIYIGIKEDGYGQEDIIYTNMGIYIINNPSESYNTTSDTMTITGLDLMARLTGLRGGNLDGIAYTISSGTNVRTAIIETLELAGFTMYVCEECVVDVPSDINFTAGVTVYDILKSLRDLVTNYEMYFDVDGVFHYELIPSGDNEQIDADDDVLLINLKEYSRDWDFEGMKNYITVYGKTHDVYHYGDAAVNGSDYEITISTVTSLYDELFIGFTAPTKITDPYINLNSYGSIPLKNNDGTFAELEDDTDVYYVAKYDLTDNYFMYMGTVTPIGIAIQDNPDSPFYTDGTLPSKVSITLEGGDYDYIYTSQLAQVRADWELYTRCKVKDSITLSLVPVLWLDVNKVIEITLPNNQGELETNKYITKQIQTGYGTSGLQTVTAMRYYPFYSNP